VEEPSFELLFKRILEPRILKDYGSDVHSFLSPHPNWSMAILEKRRQTRAILVVADANQATSLEAVLSEKCISPKSLLVVINPQRWLAD
jgi:hypothetical protein